MLVRLFLYQTQNHKQAWPFLKPVDKDKVPDYHETVKSPIDLSTLEERHEHGFYTTPRLPLIDDLKLVFSSNCRLYNDPSTIYVKCAAKLEKDMWPLVRENTEWYGLLEDD